MTLKPCAQCGEPTNGPRCTEHRPADTKTPATDRGYDWRWTQLSKRARRLQPFCTDCGTVEGLQADHLPSAWERHAAGKPIRLADIDVVCGPCNRRRGSARPGSTRGDTPPSTASRPQGKAKFESEIA